MPVAPVLGIVGAAFGQDAASIGGFGSRIQSHFPMDGGPRVTLGLRSTEKPTVKQDPQTRLYGVDASQLKAVKAVLAEELGDDLLDLAVIGSRARGSASELKGFRPVRPESDLDLAPLVRSGEKASRTDWGAVSERLRDILGFGVDLHVNFSFDGQRYSEGVPFHDGTEVPKLIPFSTGEALRLAP